MRDLPAACARLVVVEDGDSDHGVVAGGKADKVELSA